MPRAHALIGAGLVACAVTASAIAGADAKVMSLPNPDYVGQLVGTARGVVELRVNRDERRATSVRFVARRVEFECEDGTSFESSFNVRKAEATGPRTFDVFMARTGGYYRIHAELLPRGRARGFIINYDNPRDPPGFADTSVECSTVGGRLRWVAEEVRNR